jgi:hypothetical protein
MRAVATSQSCKEEGLVFLISGREIMKQCEDAQAWNPGHTLIVASDIAVVTCFYF